MSRPQPGTSDDAGMGGEVEPEHLDDPAGNRLPDPGRRALVSLLMNRYVSRTRHRGAWEGILTYENDLRDRLDEVYLDLIVDHEAEVMQAGPLGIVDGAFGALGELQQGQVHDAVRQRDRVADRRARLLDSRHAEATLVK